MPRDLLKKSGGSSSAAPPTEWSADIEGGFVDESIEKLRAFFEQVNEIRGLINAIAENTKELDQLYNSNLNETQEGVKKQRSARIDKLINDSNKAAIMTQKKLQAMLKANNDLAAKDTTNRGKSADVRTRSSQYSALTKHFSDVMGTYQEMQSKSKKDLRTRQKRELTIVSKNATDEELEAAVDNVSGPIFAQQIEQSTQRDEAKRLLAEIQSRHEDILKLEESLKELRQLFIDMQTLVEAQGEMLNEIENNVNDAVDYTEAGTKELKEAVRYQKKARTKMFILLGCVCCLIILIVVIPTATVLGPKLKSGN